MRDETYNAGDAIDLDLRVLLFALVHKLSPGKPVTLCQADIDAAWDAFPGDRPALSTTMLDGVISLEVVAAAAGKDEIDAFAAKCEGRLQ